MSRRREGTAAGRRDRSDDETDAPGDEDPGVLVRPEAYDGPAAQALVAAMIVDIEKRYAGDEGADDPDAEWAMGVDEVTPPRGVCLVAYREGQPVGCGALRPLPAAGTHVAEIKRMYTAPAARRRGVSRAVLARLESEAVSLGYRGCNSRRGCASPRRWRSTRRAATTPSPTTACTRGASSRPASPRTSSEVDGR
jgi:GNAT superfamily N-acetyltransferase